MTKEPVVVIVVSTTGDGEAPDTVSKYVRNLLEYSRVIVVCVCVCPGSGES